MFVRECTEAEYVGNGVLVKPPNEMWEWMGGAVDNTIVGLQMAEARHGTVFRPLWRLRRSGSSWVAVVGLVVLVLQIPMGGCFICPFEVEELAKRYFCTECASRCAPPLRNPASIALRRDAMGGLQKRWCANLTLLALVVHALEKPACSRMGL